MEHQIVHPTSPLDAKQRAFLVQVQRFLVNVIDPAIGVRVAQVGYNDGEHRLGWQYFTTATGQDRPFEHYLSAAEQQILQEADAVKRAIAELDEFENKWFRRVRNAIRRFVIADQREVVEAAFFNNLEQQPAGPAVVGSVTLLLERLEGLSRSDVPGAREAYQSLVNKGLGEERLFHVRGLLARAKAAFSPVEPTVPPSEQLQAAQAQRAGFDNLKLWYTDWADTLRDELGYHHAVRLGIRRVKGKRSNGNGADEPAVDEPDFGDLDFDTLDAGE